MFWTTRFWNERRMDVHSPDADDKMALRLAGKRFKECLIIRVDTTQNAEGS